MPDYSLSKIYKLVSNKSPDIYIGSCVTRLSTRLSHHKNKGNNCVSKKLFIDDAIVTIVLIEDYPCDNKNMLKARELYHITNNICINSHKPFVCEIPYEDKKEWHKQYQLANADKLTEYANEYYLTNTDKIKQSAKEYYIANADKIKQATKEYYIANADKRKKTDKEYYLANIDKIKEYKKEYRTTHKDRINAMQRAKRVEKQLAQKLETISL